MVQQSSSQCDKTTTKPRHGKRVTRPDQTNSGEMAAAQFLGVSLEMVPSRASGYVIQKVSKLRSSTPNNPIKPSVWNMLPLFSLMTVTTEKTSSPNKPT